MGTTGQPFYLESICFSGLQTILFQKCNGLKVNLVSHKHKLHLWGQPKLNIMKGNKLIFVLCFISGIAAFAQENFPVNDVRDNRANAWAFTNSTIHATAGSVYENGLMLIRKGKIEYAGPGKQVPSGYTVVDLKGKHIYPSFIDLYSNYGAPEVKPSNRSPYGSAEQIVSSREGPYNANEAVKADYNTSDDFKVNAQEAEKLRNAGFGVALTFRPDGLARGTSTLVTLADDTENNVMIEPSAGAHFAFSKGSSKQSYPISTMGFIAVLRQTYLDADWYSKLKKKPFTDKTLDAMADNKSLPQIFGASGWLTALRADKLGDEFGVQYIIKGGGDEYQRLEEVKATNAKLIVPLNFPDAFDMEDPIDAERISLGDMKHWELAPSNPGALEKAGISFSLTSDKTSPSDFLGNLRKAVKYGLSKSMALNALTQVPADMIGKGSLLGSLSSGKLANFIITSDDLFDEKTVIHQNWVQGKPYETGSPVATDYSGKYDLTVGGENFGLTISGGPGKHSAKIKSAGGQDLETKIKLDKELITLGFKADTAKSDNRFVSLSGWVTEKGFEGKGRTPEGSWTKWEATKTGEEEVADKKQDKEEPLKDLGDIIYPFLAYGSKEKPLRETVLIKNTTVWTSEKEGILEETDVLIKDGKISKIGKGLNDKADKVIDATGKHVTAGIIDEHSHLAASSINDIATNSSMVRIGDVVDSERVGLYHALAGGVTALQILHGSANPIGGQSALIKLRWGEAPEKLKIQGADGFIKFALGENVKRTSNSFSIRYPQTRMGVEQVYVDAFTNALEYEKQWKDYNSLSSRVKATTPAPRKDLVHETMLEIIRGKRFVSCHSYVQSEINMLMKVAERFGFRINTFTHILEGYKVADKMKEHGAGGSSFSDWWNYKWEVRYAIPYNATIMHREGVVTAINSDSQEMIRRLNQEAAKSVKYGGLSEIEALNMVTINPAKLLHLDDRMGSIKTGKDADLVIWSDHPLSIYAKAEKTFVDGIVYFDLERDRELRKEIEQERARLIAKMREAGKNGAKTVKKGSGYHLGFECEDILVEND